MFDHNIYYTILWAMLAIAPIVFIALQFISAGYGMMYTKKWGPTINNRLGWVLMEAPVFFAMLCLWLCSERDAETVPIIMMVFFLIHYFQRSFIFPLMIKSKGRMPLTIILMGVVFNLINAYLIGGWLFYVSAPGYYSSQWLLTPQFIAGTLIFFAGMGINIHSDHIIRTLRKPGDTRHYIPRGGMYRYVTGANYLGEFVEWSGFALLTWSWAGVVFAVWTFANLAPRARSLHKRYLSEFGDEYSRLHRRYILPFIY